VSDTSVLLDIRGRNTNALRAIASTKVALRGLTSEQRRYIQSSKEMARQSADINRLLDRQSMHLRALTGDYVALRRAVFTLGIRAAIAGFAALTSTLVATGGEVVKLASQVRDLGVAVGALGSSALAGGIQGLITYKLGLSNVADAMTKVGTSYDTAVSKMTKSEKDLLKSLKPLRKAYFDLKDVAAQGFAGLTRPAENARKLIDEVTDSVYNTATALTYLADEGVGRLVKRQGEFRRVARTQIVTMRRMGEAAIDLGDAWLAASDEAIPMVRRMSGEVKTWAENVRKDVRRAKRDGSLGEYFRDAERAWRTWSSTVGATGGAVWSFLSASEISAGKLARNINDAAKNAERWVQSEDGQRKIREGLLELEPVGEEIARTLGAVGKALIDIGIHGSGSATRVLRGFREQVLPIIHEFAINLNDNLMPAIIDVAREFTEFITNIQPGLKWVSARIGDIAEGISIGIGGLNDLLDRMPKASAAISGLALGAGILVGWGRLKQLLAESLLSIRQIVGLAPKVVAANTPIVGGASAGGGMSAVGGTYGRGRGGRASGTRGSQWVQTAASPYFNLPQISNNKIRGGLSPLSARPPRTMMESVTRRGVQYTPGPYGASWQQPRPGGMTTMATVGGRNMFFGPDGLVQRRDMPGVSRGGLPPNGPRIPRDAQAGRASLAGARASSAARNFAAVTAGMSAATVKGITGGAKAAAGPLKGIAKFGLGGALISGLLGAATPGMLKGAGNTANRFLSGASLGLIQSNDSRANQFVSDAATALQTGGSLKLDPRSDEQRAVVGKAGSFNLNLAQPRDIALLKEYADASLKANKITAQQATELNKAADAAVKYRDRMHGAERSQRDLGNALISESDLKPGVRGLDVLVSKFNDMKANVKPTLADVRDFTRGAMGSIKKYMVEGSEGARSATNRAFMQAAAGIQRGMDRGTINAEKGAKRLEQIFRKNLAMYGITGKGADRYLNGQDTLTGKRTSDSNKNVSDNVMGKARGGFVGRKGERGHDNVPALLNGQKAMVARGEYVAVLNADQQQAFDGMARAHGYGGVEGFFGSHNTPHGKTRKFAKGGILNAAGGMVPIPGEPGESIHRSILADVMKLKSRYRLDITDGYATTGHAANGEHPLGLAIDAIPGKGGSWSMVDALAKWAEPTQGNPRKPFRWVGYNGDPNHGTGNHIHLSWLANAAAIAGENMGIKRLLASGDLPSAVRGLVQGGLDGMRRGAQAKMEQALQSIGGTGAEGMEPASSVTGNGSRLMREIAAARGWNFADWWEIDRRESGHGTNLVNPTSTARLRGQFLDFNYGKYGPGSDPAQNPSMAQQIWSMAEYIQERYGNPTDALAHHDAHNWYSAGKPPTSGADAPAPQGTNPPKGKTDPAKKKDPKDKPKYAGGYPSGVANALTLSRSLLARGRKGRIKPLKLRKQVRRWMANTEGGKWLGDPNFYDPLTGEPREPGQLAMFKRLSRLQGKAPGLMSAADRLTDRHSLTDEAATLSLEGDDLRRFFKSQGMTDAQVEQEIAAYGDSREVANLHGFSVGGKFWGGLDQYTTETNQQLFAHSNIWHNALDQLNAAQRVDTKTPRDRRRGQLVKIRKFFENNREVIKALRKKIKKAGKPQTWQEQVRDNEDIIRALQRHKRDSSGLPDSYTTRINHDIDSLQDVNRDLRERQPKKRPAGMDRVARILDRAERENVRIAGGDATNWQTALGGDGIAGRAANSLTAWRGLNTYRQDSIREAKDVMSTEQTSIDMLRKDLDDFKAAGYIPKPQADTSGTDARDELLKQIGLDSLRNRRLGSFENQALSGFAQMLGMRSIGAFAHGAVDIKQTGMALLHRGETVVPDPDGPFRNGMTVNRLGGGTGWNGDVVLAADGNVAALFKLIDMRVERVVGRAQAPQGAQIRARRAAPG
jgi:hypothetical protein